MNPTELQLRSIQRRHEELSDQIERMRQENLEAPEASSDDDEDVKQAA